MSGVPHGWQIVWHRPSLPFKTLLITAPNGFAALVSSHDRNPENVLYMLAEALLPPPETPNAPYELTPQGPVAR